MKEREIQRVILDWLAAEHVLAFRMNTGAMQSEYQGKRRFMRFGTPGMADVLAFPHDTIDPIRQYDVIRPTWLECKANKGKQSELQKSFQQHVESHGHRYAICRSLDDAIRAIKG